MALFNQKAYKEKVKFVKGEIEDLNNQIDNAAPLLNELKYIKSIKERNLKLLESMGDYESFSLKWHLIKSDIDLYKKLLKDEILCQRIKTAALLMP